PICREDPHPRLAVHGGAAGRGHRVQLDVVAGGVQSLQQHLHDGEYLSLGRGGRHRHAGDQGPRHRRRGRVQAPRLLRRRRPCDRPRRVHRDQRDDVQRDLQVEAGARLQQQPRRHVLVEDALGTLGRPRPRRNAHDPSDHHHDEHDHNDHHQHHVHDDDHHHVHDHDRAADLDHDHHHATPDDHHPAAHDHHHHHHRRDVDHYNGNDYDNNHDPHHTHGTHDYVAFTG